MTPALRSFIYQHLMPKSGQFGLDEKGRIRHKVHKTVDKECACLVIGIQEYPHIHSNNEADEILREKYRLDTKDSTDLILAADNLVRHSLIPQDQSLREELLKLC